MSEIYIDLDQPQKEIAAQSSLGSQHIVTPYYTVRTENSGRRLIIDIHGDIKSSLHNRLVVEYCKRLHKKGFSFNADDVPFPVDRELKLSVRSGMGSKRRFDIIDR